MIRFNVVGYIDRRSERLHAAYDAIVERNFAQRVARNHKERDRLTVGYVRRPVTPPVSRSRSGAILW